MVKQKNQELIEIKAKDMNEIKEELLLYTKDRIDIEVQNSFKKIEKKIVNRKNSKILRRDILIIILIGITGFLTFELYNTGYFNKYLIKLENNTSIEMKNEVLENQNQESNNKVVKEDLISKHKDALNSFKISSDSIYIKDFYNGKLSNELKLYLSFSNLDKNAIQIDDGTLIISEDDLVSSYKKLFDDEYQAVSFNYNSLRFKYLKSQNIYLAYGELKSNKSNIKRIIKDVEENNDEIVITTIEAIVDNDKVINILSNKEIAGYTNDNSIISNQSKLNTMKYYFKLINKEYYLENISAQNE